MKFIHLSDLHLGKRVNEFSMLEDQKYILLKILQIIKSEKPDGVLIAGDIYDKSIPPAEAVQLTTSCLGWQSWRSRFSSSAAITIRRSALPSAAG